MSPCKVLIIDDDKDDVEILSDAFQSCGVDAVHYVYSAMQAFMYLEAQKENEHLPKLMVTDLYLPGITGAHFLKDLKEMERYKHIPAIILSSIKNEQEIEKYRQLGFVDYVVKPSSYEEYLKVAADMKSKAGL